MTQYEKDQKRYIDFDGSSMIRAHYILLLSIREVKIWKSERRRPYISWRLKQVKEYFGIKGSSDFVLQQLLKLKAEVKIVKL